MADQMWKDFNVFCAEHVLRKLQEWGVPEAEEASRLLESREYEKAHARHMEVLREDRYGEFGWLITLVESALDPNPVLHTCVRRGIQYHPTWRVAIETLEHFAFERKDRAEVIRAAKVAQVKWLRATPWAYYEWLGYQAEEFLASKVKELYPEALA